MNDFSLKIDARKKEFLIQISSFLRKNEMDFQSRGKPKKEHSIENISFINMKGGMKSRLNKSNKKGSLYKK